MTEQEAKEVIFRTMNLIRTRKLSNLVTLTEPGPVSMLVEACDIMDNAWRVYSDVDDNK